MPEQFKYDVFLSHSTTDKPVVRELAERLKADGLRVWFDEWEIEPGDMIGLKIEEGLEQSRTLVLVMSANAFASEWVTLERHTVVFRDPTNAQRRFIPLRLDDAEIKATLRQFAYVDWRQRSSEQLERLLAACRPVFARSDGSLEEKSTSQRSSVFKGHTGHVCGVAVTPDGRRVVSGSDDKTLRVWEMNSGNCLAVLEGHTGSVHAVAVTPDGRNVISGSADGTIRIWEISSTKCIALLRGHTGSVNTVVVTPDGECIVSGSYDKSVRLWNVSSKRCVGIISEHLDAVSGVAVSPDGKLIVSGSWDKSVRVWERDSDKRLAFLRCDEPVWSVAVTSDGHRVVCGAGGRVHVWEMTSGSRLSDLIGHTHYVSGVASIPGGQHIVSGSYDKTVRVWDPVSGKCAGILEGCTNAVVGIAVSPDGESVVSGSYDTTVRVWKLHSAATVLRAEAGVAHYTNAKVLLVGDSGVGKSGLALRLSQDRFEPTISTDGAVVSRVTDEWATQLRLRHEANTNDIEREVWLWDFAGQSDYRLIHQLFLDEAALAALVFDPQSENPFEGLGEWDRDLQRAARRPFKKLLVAGRCDRGGLMVSRNSIERFRRERGFARYLETSAYTGAGCSELRDAIIHSISWDDIPWIASPRIFKLLKEEIVRLKDEGQVLLRMTELKQQLEMRISNDSFTLEQLRAVVGLLASPGIVWQLEFGDFIVLQPERINGYAAAVIRKVRAHTEEIGIIPEDDVLAGKLDYQRMKRLPPEDEQIVLRAMHQTFVDHGLCLREATEVGTLLVFPSYFKRELPELKGYPAVLVTYQFNGRLEEIYSTLVVRLHHTMVFEKDQLWRFAADFKTQAGKRVGLKMTKLGEGAAEIAVYFGPGVLDDTKVTFIRYVHEHLKVKAQDVIRLRHYVCPHCETPVENRKAAWERLHCGLKDILCVNCEKRVPLWDLIEQKFASDEFQQRVRELEEQARISIDNESRELILVGHAFAIAGEAGQIFRPTPNSDWGIDGEIEFKNEKSEASGKRVYLQLKSGDSYLHTREDDGKEIFRIKSTRHVEYWQTQAYPVMLVIRTSDGQIRWMNVSEYLKQHGTSSKEVVFEGEPFTALSVSRLRDKLFSQSS